MHPTLLPNHRIAAEGNSHQQSFNPSYSMASVCSFLPWYLIQPRFSFFCLSSSHTATSVSQIPLSFCPPCSTLSRTFYLAPAFPAALEAPRREEGFPEKAGFHSRIAGVICVPACGLSPVSCHSVAQHDSARWV